MPRSSLSRLLCGLLVTALLAAPLAAAEPAHPAEPRAGGLSAGLSSLWTWLVELWGDEGCYIDPYGSCRDSMRGTPSVPADNDNGCYIDPYGGCLSGTHSTPSVPEQVDAGCYIDPYGGCHG